MSRLPSLFTLVMISLASGCMYQQPMYQPGYGQQMYAPGGYAQPGTIVVPQSNAPAYDPSSTYDNPNDDFKTDGTSGKDPRFFSGDDDGKVPSPKDPNSGEPFSRDLSPTNP